MQDVSALLRNLNISILHIDLPVNLRVEFYLFGEFPSSLISGIHNGSIYNYIHVKSYIILENLNVDLV